MKIHKKLPPGLRLSIIFSLFFIYSHASVVDPSDCAVTRYHGQGYTTSISFVSENTDGSHTIVLIVNNDGCPGPGCEMTQYSVEADPGTYSDISVQTLSGGFTYESINYGPGIDGCQFQGFSINNTSGIGNGQSASFSVTYKLTGGLQGQSTQVVTSSSDHLVNFSVAKFQLVLECSDVENIIPYYTPPDEGKVYDLIGAELTSLYNTYITTGSYTSDDIFQIVGTSVSIDIFVNAGQYDSTLFLLTSPEYGLTSESGDPDQLIINGLLPIVNLLSLNDLPVLINEARPVYTALGNRGIVTSQGDTAVRSYLARKAFDVTGLGIKIGVLSDSYNTKLGDPASDDVLRGDLPGLTNPYNSFPVDVIRDYPYGSRSDEGRAMLQIIHDVAPGSELAFRTGFLGPADFAKGIIELQQADCDIIVEDITYISEPFFRDGIVAKAVDSVASLGVTYFSAAGNFGSRTYESVFYPSTAPDSITGEAHNFAGTVGGTDIYQNISLAPGNYTVVLQWDDGTPGNYTGSDFDIYLSEDDGSTLFGFNRVNTGRTPLEVLPFTVVGDSAQSNFMIIRAAGSGAAMLKYIIFRGDIQINEYATTGGSTLVGQANAEGAIAVGAVLYSNTPEYGVNPPTVASFSSRGGTPVSGINRFKPEITAPNGVNTTVDLGGFDIDGDEFPNFFGTSAAAPHAAGIAALIQEARQKYYGTTLSPAVLEELLQSTAIDMYTPGYDPQSGAGFINTDGTLSSFANPAPYITGISYDTTLTPGQVPVEITIFGQYLTDATRVYFNGVPLDSVTAVISDTVVTTTIPVFDERYPLIQVYNPPKAGTNGTDGGYSEPLYFTASESIVVMIDDKSKKYGEGLPEFTAGYFIEDINGITPLDSAGLTPEETGRIRSVAFETIATAFSNTGLWEIKASSTDPLNPLSGIPAVDSLDISLLERFNFDFVSGILTIDKLDLVISPKDTTFTYGDVIGGFDYEFYFNNDSVNLEYGFQISEADSMAILSSFRANYATALVNETALVNAKSFITATALVNKSMMISNATFNKFATALVNGTFISGPSFQTATALVNVLSFTGKSALAPATALVNGDVVVNTVDSTGTILNTVNLDDENVISNAFGGATALVNTNTVNADNNSQAIVILGGDDITILSGDSTGYIELLGINLITGNTVGQHFIVPGSFLSNNFNISYLPGILDIVPDTAIVVIDTAGLSHVYDGTAKTVAVTTNPAGLSVDVTYNSLSASPVNAGSYLVHAVVVDSNYVGGASETLVISPVTVTVTADLKWIYDYDPLPEFTATFSGFIGSDDESVVDTLYFSVSPEYTGAAGTYQIIPAATATNYIFTPVNGPLYVNPNGLTARQIKVYLDCVEALEDPDNEGYNFIAHFTYTSNNVTDVYIPVGSDNFLSGFGSYNADDQPELFVPGGGTFDVPFNGVKVTWKVKSYRSNGQKYAHSAFATASSVSCNDDKAAEAEPLPVENEAGSHRELKVYPNPTSGKLTIELNGETVTGDDIRIYDIYGKTLPMQAIASSDRQVEIDLSGYPAGIYFVRINTGDTISVSRIIKK